MDQTLKCLQFAPILNDHTDSIDLRSTVCDSCTAKSRDLLSSLRSDMESLCRDPELQMDLLEIRRAHESLKRLSKLQSSQFVRRETVATQEEYLRLKELFKVGLLTKSEIVNNAEKVNKCAREFQAVDDLFFRHRRDECLDELKQGLDVCRQGLRAADTNPRSLQDCKSKMAELVKYETALSGLGCDEKIKQNKEDIFQELEDTQPVAHRDRNEDDRGSVE